MRCCDHPLRKKKASENKNIPFYKKDATVQSVNTIPRLHVPRDNRLSIQSLGDPLSGKKGEVSKNPQGRANAIAKKIVTVQSVQTNECMYQFLPRSTKLCVGAMVEDLCRFGLDTSPEMCQCCPQCRVCAGKPYKEKEQREDGKSIVNAN